MKLAQFKTKDSERRRLGILIDNVVCDVADLARAAKSAGESHQANKAVGNKALHIPLLPTLLASQEQN